MKLASIERITEIKPIEGADKILAAKVLGYWTVIKKDEFAVGDYCVWHNPDTIVDIEKFPEAYSILKEPRLKVIKLRKQVSQGLALPAGKFPVFCEEATKWELIARATGKPDCEREWKADTSPPTMVINYNLEGVDVSDLIGIKKYEKPIPECMKGVTKGTFPSFIPKTDENNLRSYPAILKNLYAEDDVYITVKVDGQSSTYYYKDGVFGVCSRNQELLFNENNGFWKNAVRYRIENALEKYSARTGKFWALQGESYGPGIQANKLGATDLSFAAFALFNISDGYVASLQEFWDFCGYYLIPSVYKLEHTGKLENFGKNIDEILDKVNAQQYTNKSPAEGLVFRTTRQIPWSDLRDLSGKIISEKFALKHGE